MRDMLYCTVALVQEDRAVLTYTARQQQPWPWLLCLTEKLTNNAKA